LSGLAALLGVAALAGWGVVLVLALSGRRRLALVLDAEHELRGAAAAMGLAAERLSRTGATVAFASLVRLQLDRMAAGLEDLAAARALRGASRAARAGDVEIDAGRLAQVLANLIANAGEHGVGPVEVTTSRPAGAVRIEIRNRNRPRELEDASMARAAGRGRGLAIAERAARELGGRLTVESRGGETRAELELPAPEADDADRTRAAPTGNRAEGTSAGAEADGAGPTRAEAAADGAGRTRAEAAADGAGRTRAAADPGAAAGTIGGSSSAA
jgi:signal transduction histidine kinase